MTHEYEEQRALEGQYGSFWMWRRANGEWGGISTYRLASFAGRGGTIKVRGYGAENGPELQIAVSDAGRSIRVWKDHKEMTVREDE